MTASTMCRSSVVQWLFCAMLLAGTSVAGQKPATDLAAQNRVSDQVFRSASLQRDMHYRVLFPPGYEKGGRFLSLYLLHGIFGDYKNWDTRTHLENYARDLNVLIVMPDADDSWYANSATVPADKFEDYIVKDLITEIDAKYRTIHDGHARAIAGLSMGGYGAVKFALKYPELFAFAASLSGAFDGPQDLDKLRPEFRQSLVAAFGEQSNPARSENDIFALLSTPHSVAFPYFYLACGTSDFFLNTNRAFVQQLSARKIGYEYHETPGAHTWEYWDGALEPVLKALMEHLHSTAELASPRGN